MNIEASQIFATKKNLLHAMNSRMTFFKWLFLLALVAIPLGIAVETEASEIIAMFFAAFLLFLFNLGIRVTNYFTLSNKESAVFFEARKYLITEHEITIEYSDEETAVFSNTKKLKVKQKKQYFTIREKNQGFEIIPMSVFTSEEQKEWFKTSYMEKKK